MSFLSEVTRLKDAKNDIRTSIINKGVDVDSSATISNYSEYIDMIPPYKPAPANLSEYEYDNLGRLVTCTTNSNVTSINGELKSFRIMSVSMPNVTSIGDRAFYNCPSLTSVSMPSVTSIGTSAFLNCTSLTSINIPSGVTSIGDDAFQSCTSLTSIDIPSSVTKLGGYISGSIFLNCTSLTSVSMPKVTFIGYGVFKGCTKLTSVSMPSVTSIYNNAFDSCTSLTSIDIPSSVTYIDHRSFYNCTKLVSVTCRATTPPTFGNTAFSGTSTDLVIYVPAASVNAYKTASGWSDYADKIQAIP